MYIGFGPGFYTRTGYNQPPRDLVNLFPEQTPNQPDRGYTLLPTPGLVQYLELSETKIMRGIFYQEGVFGGDIFVVFGDTFARINSSGTVTNISTSVPGTEAVSLAFSLIDELILVADGNVYSYDDSTFAEETVNNAINFVSVAFIDSRFVVVGNDSSRFYWSNVLSTTFGSLSFATAEYSGDNLVTIIAQRSDIILFGTKTIEIWASSGDADAPFQRRSGSVIEKGCIGPRAAVLVDQVVCWVGSDDVVYTLSGGSASSISTPAIADKMGSSDTRLTFYVEDNHQFLVINQPTSCFVYDVPLGEWHERESSGFASYQPFQYVVRSGTLYGASRFNGKVYRSDKTVYTEDGNYIAREASLYVPVQARINCANVILDGARGAGLITGQGEDPIILLSWSDDGGNTYTAPRNIYPGKLGKFASRMFTTRLGMMRPPGRVFRVRFTDPTLFRLDGMRINEASY